MFNFFSKKVEKKELDEIKIAVQTGFNKVKQDINSYSQWIKHLNKNNSIINVDIVSIKEDLSNVKNDLENIKNILDIISNKSTFKHKQTVFNKQTDVLSVLNSVQTDVQTSFLDNLTVNERAIIFVLINSDLKLSYEDLAAMLGKRKSTVRGQVNSIRQKSGGLIQEIIGENNKKRIFIPDKVKEILLKTKKVRVKKNEN
jgi:DNA-directed RNA polymerase specialized sigma24 family protein